MAGATTAQTRPRLAAYTIGIAACVGLLAPSASAIEFADGRVQIHGFGEIQMRALDEKFQEELDLAQWYNVINVEVELDIAPDGWGPFDLISAYVRGEARYDAIYSNGFGMFPSVNTFGDDAERLPLRLRDALDKEFAGQIRATDRDGVFATPRIEDRDPHPLVPAGERLGFPGYDTFFRNAGPDNLLGPNPNENRGSVSTGRSFDDPAWYIHEEILDYRFAFKEVRGTANTGTQILGPWLPKNFIRSVALNPHIGNPFRGRLAPTKPREVRFGSNGIPAAQFPALAGLTLIGANNPDATRHFAGDPGLVLGAGEEAIVDRLDPLLAAVLTAPDDVVVAMVDLDGNWSIGDDPATGPDTTPAQPLNELFPTVDSARVMAGIDAPFGGDFAGGIASCLDPTSPNAVDLREGANFEESKTCIRGAVSGVVGAVENDTNADFPDAEIYIDPRIFGVTKMTGGGGENPFRPAPDISNLGRVVWGEDPDNPGELIVLRDAGDDTTSHMHAQGLFYSSRGLRDTLESGRLDALDMNYDEDDRSWNRGQSQERNKELKEAYVDLELMDSRLWLRLGLQNIVWGKTELFRTTDQFNPQDLALASLPSLEESRIALWSARAVYSLYDVGVLEDVRLEFAANLDHYQPGDLGACGEPFTIDLVCSLTTGVFAHGLLGIGVVGIDRPEAPWKEFSDLEFGGRIEWRWDRFSFALTDFYGFSDFPYVDAVFFYERAVDYTSGRPLVARLPGQTLGKCGSVNAGEPSSVGVGLAYSGSSSAYSTAFASHPLSVTTGVDIQNGPAAVQGKWRGGIGYDPDCLRPGGRPGEPNAFPTDFDADNFLRNGAGDLVDEDGNVVAEEDAVLVPLLRDDGSVVFDDIGSTNALEYHSANQQIFSWVCLGTVGIAATVDASACAWTVFSSPEIVDEDLVPTPLSESFPIIFAGSRSTDSATFLNTVVDSQKDPEQAADVFMPLVSLNRLFNDPRNPLSDRNGDGVIDDTGCDDPDPAVRADCDLAGFDGFDTRITIVAGNCVIRATGAPCPAGATVRSPASLAALNARLRDNPLTGMKVNEILDFEAVQYSYQTLDSSLTNEQRALLGCGPFFGIRCDSSATTTTIADAGPIQTPVDRTEKPYARAGGIDFLNMEGSVMLQAWPGVEGTWDGHRTDMSLRDRMQPATVADGSAAAGIGNEGRFLGGAVCTRFVESMGRTVTLPGCRGVYKLTIDRVDDTPFADDEMARMSAPESVAVVFDDGYMPSIDGCMIGDSVEYAGAANGVNVPVVASYVGGGDPTELRKEVELCSDAIRERANSQIILDRSGPLYSDIVLDAEGNYVSGGVPNLINTGQAGCVGARFPNQNEPGTPANGTPGVTGGRLLFAYCQSALARLEELPLIHPTAGCVDSDVWWEARDLGNANTLGKSIGGCEFFQERQLVREFFEGDAALFQNELAAFSWNFMQFLAASSCNQKSKDLDGRNHAGGNVVQNFRADPQCFDAERPWTPGRCSFASPHLCTNVKGLIGAAGLRRNTVTAGGNGSHGRRTFLWNSGGEIVLTYEKRNVLGFSTDFAEDVTKTNWGVEFTWIEDIPFTDASSPTGITYSDTYNLTVSIDRPTFINFLNPNRTFFFNTQWFFNYVPEYNHNFTSNGNYNILFTFAMFTGYFQDRVMPQLVTVYDFNSRSGGVLPTMQYRFTEAFSVQVGMLYFFGRTQMTPMPVNEFGPASNRGPENTYDSPTDNLLSLIRKRDEVFMRLRWTF